jgi:hypothetical protein
VTTLDDEEDTRAALAEVLASTIREVERAERGEGRVRS